MLRAARLRQSTDPTTTTDASGTYNFISASTPFVLAHGWWQITAKPFGYQPKSDVIQVEPGFVHG